MSESTVKSSNKKAFKAPILKVLQPGGEENKPKDKGSSQKVKKDEEKQVKKPESRGDNLSQKKGKKPKMNDKENMETVVSPPKEKKLKKNHKENKECGESVVSLPIEKNFKKPEVSLTDSQYEEIFKAVLMDANTHKPEVSLRDSQYEEIFKAVLMDPNTNEDPSIEEILEIMASSSERSSVIGGQQMPLTESDGSEKTLVSLKKTNPFVPQLSPWGSHLKKQKTQASIMLKELQEARATSPLSSDVDTDGDVLSQKSVQDLSQRSYTDPMPTLKLKLHRHKVDKRPLLEELQAARNVGLWVYCDRKTCQKQRYLADVTDPQELPDVWYCHMNPDPKYNSCSCEEQQPSLEDEDDMINNQFTCGSVVWARVTGYPWWPAIVDNDPDLEWYYWLLEDMRTVTFYHVVFFDKKEVTRAWVSTNDILPYKKNHNPFKKLVTTRGIDFKPRLQIAREQADAALSMTVAHRLKKFSFIARYKGPIFDDQIEGEKVKEGKLKCFIGKKEAGKRGCKRRANTSEETPFEAVVKSNLNKKDSKKIKLSDEKVFADKNENDSNTNVELAEVEKQLNNESEDTRVVRSTIEDEKINQKNEISNTSEIPLVNFDGQKFGKSVGESGQAETETPSDINVSNMPQETQISKGVKTAVDILEDSLGSFIEPSQSLDQPSTKNEESQQNQHSQSTIADFLAALTEDAVVPEANLSQQSEPFEE